MSSEILVPQEKKLLIPGPNGADYGAALKFAQKMFDRKIEEDKALYKKRQAGVSKDMVNRPYITDTLGQHMGTVEANAWFRWQQEDRYFWDDPKNIKRFMEDNPECKRRRPDGYQQKYY